ncbi:MAG: 6,7-dimethyl-8-ribityllumazine synthase [Chitinophagales bacterium]|jgi:6,7-dimethyl-8-ribityllumazine synthase|nr:6,7-dimethyl-8-ribityllumazine synthase [Chitinophagales bacterium]
MASHLNNLSEHQLGEIPDLSNAKFGIIVSEWNTDITALLYNGCRDTLQDFGLKKKNLLKIEVPGSYELPGAAKILLESKKMDAIICLGCVIQGETRHFEFISNAAAQGIMELNIRFTTPVIFGVLTVNDLAQAQDRAGGKHGNKGVEAAISAVKMMMLRKKLMK